jgi:hypothetical protein
MRDKALTFVFKILGVALTAFFIFGIYNKLADGFRINYRLGIALIVIGLLYLLFYFKRK